MDAGKSSRTDPEPRAYGPSLSERSLFDDAGTPVWIGEDELDDGAADVKAADEGPAV